MKCQEWFTVEQADSDTYIISEYGHWEETHCYLLLGSERALLIDTGLGIGDVSAVAYGLTSLPVAAAATHIHWDHIGGHRFFPEFYVHGTEAGWLSGEFPLPLNAVKAMVSRCEQLPASFDLTKYELFRGVPSRILTDREWIDLGDRYVQVLHTPGHSPGHLCFWEPERGYLFSGDLIYKGTLYANYPSTDPAAYLASLEKLAELPVRRIFPGHHDLSVSNDLVVEMRDALRRLKTVGLLCHGSGTHRFAEWSIQL